MHKLNELLPALRKASTTFLGHFLVLLGVRPETPLDANTSEDERGLVAVAALLRQQGEVALHSSDLVSPGWHYVAAIQSYREALACAGAADHDCAIDSSTAWLDTLSELQIEHAIGAFRQSPASVRNRLRTSVVGIASLGAAERRDLAFILSRLSGTVLKERALLSDKRRRLQLAQPIRFALSLLAILSLFVLAMMVRNARTDLTSQSDWRTSSELVQCRPLNSGGCPGGPGVFFHTQNEDNPWIEYDFHKPTRFSKLVVENAQTGYRERAVPLIAEVSNDRERWQEVARNATEFMVWTAAFPAVTARYLRFRVPRVTYLHLASVEIRK